MKTKGALIWEFNQPWSIEEIEIGDPVKDEVKIQMEASGMCHSDHHLVTGDIPMAGFPVLGGHEGAGIVTEVGPGVENVAAGDHVVLSFIPSCGECPTCQAGLRNLCDLGACCSPAPPSPTAPTASTANGKPVIPMTLLGTFSPYMVVHKSSVVKIDPSDPVRGGLPGRLRRDHRLRLGGAQRGRPPGRRRRDRRRRRRRHGRAAGRGRSPAPATSSRSTRSSGSAIRRSSSVPPTPTRTSPRR